MLYYQQGVVKMPKPISDEKRADIIKHIQAGESKEDVAKWLLITLRTVNRVIKRYNETGSYAALPNGGGQKPLITEETMNQVVAKVKEVPDMTLLELIDEFDLPFSESALSRRLTRLGFTYKKRRFIQMDEREKM
jgi:transposase